MLVYQWVGHTTWSIGSQLSRNRVSCVLDFVHPVTSRLCGPCLVNYGELSWLSMTKPLKFLAEAACTTDGQTPWLKQRRNSRLATKHRCLDAVPHQQKTWKISQQLQVWLSSISPRSFWAHAMVGPFAYWSLHPFSKRWWHGHIRSLLESNPILLWVKAEGKDSDNNWGFKPSGKYSHFEKRSHLLLLQSIYIYMYIYIYVCKYIYIYIHIHVNM